MSHLAGVSNAVITTTQIQYLVIESVFKLGYNHAVIGQGVIDKTISNTVR